ncbi:hypothetical protein NKH17_26560 [Mesorhizobium sp. M1334]|uniref:hypothetical protein n=1 Tax=Mesorhizobium sp. M1334 TaxID=2957084 RepID=UPI0033376053
MVRRIVGWRGWKPPQPWRSSMRRVNFFQPSFKLAAKERDGARVRKRYYRPLRIRSIRKSSRRENRATGFLTLVTNELQAWFDQQPWRSHELLERLQAECPTLQRRSPLEDLTKGKGARNGVRRDAVRAGNRADDELIRILVVGNITMRQRIMSVGSIRVRLYALLPRRILKPYSKNSPGDPPSRTQAAHSIHPSP